MTRHLDHTALNAVHAAFFSRRVNGVDEPSEEPEYWASLFINCIPKTAGPAKLK